MRTRINIVLPEDLLAKVEIIAGSKPRLSTVIETALREYVLREESKEVNAFNAQPLYRKAYGPK